MELVSIYQCLCDRTRLRLLHLLLQGPLCVCHFQAVLGEPQVKVSKHLAYLRRHGLVVAVRAGNRMIYRLPRPRPPRLGVQLACLQDCASGEPVFRADLRRLHALRPRAGWDGCGARPARAAAS